MSGQLHAQLRTVRSRGAAYVRLFGWLWRRALARAKWTILASASATAGGILMHGLSLALLARLVGDMQREGRLNSFPGLARLGLDLPAPSALAATAVFITVFTLGSVLTYLGRSTAIRLETLLYRHFADGIYDRLAPAAADEGGSIGGVYRRRSLGSRHALLKILLSDCRFPGVVVRLSLFNIGHMGSVMLGLAVLSFHAPMLLPLVAAFALLALALLYPLTLAAARSTRELEALSARRTEYIRTRLGAALNGQPADSRIDGLDDEFAGDIEEVEARIPAPASAAALDDYLLQVENRLRITEVSRALMSSLMAAGIGTLMWLLFAGQLAQVSSASSLLVLLFGLRFVLTGIEGSMVALTSINRYLPHLVRLHALARDLDHTEAALPAALGIVSGVYADGAILAREDIADCASEWRLETPNLQTLAGKLSPGEVFHITSPNLDYETGLELFRALLREPVDGQADAVTRLRRSQASRPDYAAILDATPGSAQWIADLVTEGKFAIDAETVCLIARLQSPLPKREAEIVRFAIRCLHQSQAGVPLAALDQRLLGQLNEVGQRRLLSIFEHCTVLLIDRDCMRAIDAPLGNLLLVGNGTRIVCGVPRRDLHPQAVEALAAIVRGEWLAAGSGRN